MLTPSLAEFSRMAKKKRWIPLRKRIPADMETPVSAFLKLKARGAVFLLESVERGVQVGRYSFIGVSPFATMKLQGGKIEVRRNGEREVLCTAGCDPLDFVRRELTCSPLALEGDLPGPFAGAVGYISYDLAGYFEKLPDSSPDTLGLPDFYFLFPASLVVFDHVRREMEILSLPAGDKPELAYARSKDEIDSLIAALSKPAPARLTRAVVRPASVPAFNMSKTSFEERVRKAKEYILSGEAFQIVLSQRLEGETNTSPFQIYRALRILNPSPYMFFIDFGDFQLIGSSPEVLVKLDKGIATLCPIAGTRPRGKTASEDEWLEAELKTSEKERSEHVMLVDLGRNDLGKVCEMGSVVTESLMSIEKYSHVMHMVSRIRGTLRLEFDMFDLLEAAFPAGTVTGAPKIRAMEIISELEGEKRGPYAGALGYFGRQGKMDMCITIRTIIMRDNRYFVQGGAGIVADSSPEGEYAETLSKIKALKKAIAKAEEGF